MHADEFTKHPDVVALLTQLQTDYAVRPGQYEQSHLYVSDVIDAQHHQYVNLVQEGGGVWGVALLGYTYVLEQMGIRFMKIAGTSAGAINALLLVAVGQREEAKSEPLIEYISNTDLFSFVDGSPWTRQLIRRFSTQKGFVEDLSNLVKTIVTSVFVLLALCLSSWLLTAVAFANWPGQLVGLISVSTLLTGLITGVLIALLLSARALRKHLREFRSNGYGLNPGNVLLRWMRDLLHRQQIHNLSDLEAKLTHVPPGLQLRASRASESLDDLLHPDLTFLSLIASELETENKIEFPKMWCLFREHKKDIDPADFVRASMSIPLFFRSYPMTVKSTGALVEGTNQTIADSWQQYLGVTNVPRRVQFVDGGVLSNFPINVFYNPTPDQPRLPTFGIVFNEGTTKSLSRRAGFGQFLLAMFNTIRFYYDKDFQLRHHDFEKTIGQIDVRGANWLNFSLTDAEKVDLFLRGVRAADAFLRSFDWPAYKAARMPLKQALSTGTESIKP